jgi:hypothetical protein
MRQRIEVTDEQRQQAWEIYARQPERHLPEIQTFLGVSAGTFVRMRERWGWPSRRAALDANAMSMAAKDEGGVAGLAKAAVASVNDAARALAQATRVQIGAAQGAGQGSRQDGPPARVLCEDAGSRAGASGTGKFTAR